MTWTARLPQLLAACGLLLGATPPAKMAVQVKAGQLRATPSFLGKLLQTAPYGTPLEILQSQGDWMQVRGAQGLAGWIHRSALTAKRVAMASGGTVKAGVSRDELALAGKGFNAEIEREYRRQKGGLDFEALDRLEARRPSADQLEAFARKGGLKTEGGAK